jgi:hypothetical protein
MGYLARRAEFRADLGPRLSIVPLETKSVALRAPIRKTSISMPVSDTRGGATQNRLHLGAYFSELSLGRLADRTVAHRFIAIVVTPLLWIIAVEGLAQAESERRHVKLYESDKL